jgi:TPR repeat protein
MLAQTEPRDLAKAHALYDRACRGGYLAACFNLGLAHTNGEGGAKDAKRALPLFKRACDGQLAIACTNLGSLYATGEGVAANDTLAFELYERGCAGGDPKGCVNLGVACNQGRGTAKDVKRAATYFDKACTGGEGVACNELALLHFDGAGVDQDFDRGNALLQRACELDKEYCSDAFFKRLRDSLRKKPADQLSTECEAQAVEACNALAEKYASGDGVPKDVKKAVAIYKKSCAAGDRRACSALQQVRP